MTEPLSTAAVGAAFSATVMAAIGVEPQPIYWALFGASLGLSAAAGAGRLRTAGVFAAVVMCCSLFGTWLSARWFNGDPLTRNAAACVMALFFHPLFIALVARLPQVIDAALKKVGVT